MADTAPAAAEVRLYRAGLAVCLIPAATIWRAYVLTVLWAWFAVGPLGLPAVGLAPMYGLSLFFSLLTYRRQAHDPDLRLSVLILDALCVPALTLGLGWIVKAFL